MHDTPLDGYRRRGRWVLSPTGWAGVARRCSRSGASRCCCPAPPTQAALDFNVGCVGTALLAALFLFLGAVMRHGSGEVVPSSGAAFAALLVRVYTEALGGWVRPLVLSAALATMISTTLAVLDGFPRAVEGALLTLRAEGATMRDRAAVHWVTFAICAVGALVGPTVPAFPLLNWRVLCGDEVPDALRPSALYTAYHLAGIALLTAMAVAYVAVRIGVV